MDGVQITRCRFGCACGADKLEHYLQCEVIWGVLSAPPPAGIHLDRQYRSVSQMLMLERKLDNMSVARIGIFHHSFAKSMIAINARSHVQHNADDVRQLLRIHGREGAQGSKSRSIWMIQQDERACK